MPQLRGGIQISPRRNRLSSMEGIVLKKLHLLTTAAVLLALSVSGPASANPSAAQDLVDSMPEAPLVALNDGESMLLAQANKAKEKEKSGKPQSQAQKAQGYEKSGNPKAAGGPQNPGKGKPQKPSDVRPEQPIETPKPEQPVETPKPEPRDKDGNG